MDWREYEQRVRQLLDRHVVARDVVKLVEPLNIFDDIAIEARRKDKAQTDASIADTIAHQLTRSMEEKWGEDPTFFEKFSKLIRDTIADCVSVYMSRHGRPGVRSEAALRQTEGLRQQPTFDPGRFTPSRRRFYALAAFVARGCPDFR